MRHNLNIIRCFEKFLQIRGNKDDGISLVRFIPEKYVDHYIHCLRRLIAQQNLWVGLQCLCENYLLLVSAGKLQYRLIRALCFNIKHFNFFLLCLLSPLLLLRCQKVRHSDRS